jgi:nicotinate dehydrogenase subunit A
MTTITVNGQQHQVDAAPSTPLLYVLRNDLKLNGAKFGCGLGQCGACTVLIDHEPVFSCLTPISILEGRQVTTLEGLGTPDKPGPVQRAFIAEQAAQCGYCIPGMVMRAQALIEHKPHASESEIRDYMAPNLCRCGTQIRILRAIRRAMNDMRTASAEGVR